VIEAQQLRHQYEPHTDSPIPADSLSPKAVTTTAQPSTRASHWLVSPWFPPCTGKRHDNGSAINTGLTLADQMTTLPKPPSLTPQRRSPASFHPPHPHPEPTARHVAQNTTRTLAHSHLHPCTLAHKSADTSNPGFAALPLGTTRPPRAIQTISTPSRPCAYGLHYPLTRPVRHEQEACSTLIPTPWPRETLPLPSWTHTIAALHGIPWASWPPRGVATSAPVAPDTRRAGISPLGGREGEERRGKGRRG
jgi:hypothetical protein